MGSENISFFDRLFKGRVLWSLHTAMTCDLAYVSALVKMQQGSDPLHSSDDCAFFYDYNPQKGRNLTCKIKSPDFAVSELVKYTYKMPSTQSRQTHHAKISVICYDGECKKQYRLAVYSKNLEFSNNIDAALLFELEVGDEETESGRQLISYINKVIDITEEKGRGWLERHFTEEVKQQLSKASLISELTNGNTAGAYKAELFFGGCGRGSLGELLRLDRCEGNGVSVVLTPPEFVRGTTAQTFFETTKPGMLYDVDKEKSDKKCASHIKLYLLQESDSLHKPIYELWTGSANATERGLGWDFKNCRAANSVPSVECLVKLPLTGENEFDELRKSFIGNQKQQFNYKAFDFSKDRGSLDITPDILGAYVIENYGCAGIAYDETNQVIEVTLEAKEGCPEAGPNGADAIPWRPLEYAKEQHGDFCINSGAGSLGRPQVVLKYQYDKFIASQGMIVFGTGCSIMDVSDKIPSGIARMKTKPVKDSIVTGWLLHPDSIPEQENEKWDDKLKWMYHTLTGKNPVDISSGDVSTGAQQQDMQVAGGHNINNTGSLPETTQTAKVQAMGFQKNAAKRLCDIFMENSRAFLADEPGLGKTFTSAMVMRTLAEKQRNTGKDDPFYVIYIAPNLALLESNGTELVRKYKDVSGEENIVLLREMLGFYSGILRKAYSLYYQWRINEVNEKKRKDSRNKSVSKDMLEKTVARQILEELLVGNDVDNRIQALLSKSGVEPVTNQIEHRLESGSNANSALKNSLPFQGDKWAYFKEKYVDRFYEISAKNAIARLEKVRDEIIKAVPNALTGQRGGMAGFANLYWRKDSKVYPSWAKLLPFYDAVKGDEEKISPDRIASAKEIIENNAGQLQGKTVIITVSAEVALGEERSDAERSKYKMDGIEYPCRDSFTKAFLEKYKPGLVIWDEYHRYITKLNDNNAFFEFEQNPDSPMKALFVSATPYRTNISGEDNKEMLEELYENARGAAALAHTRDDEMPDTKLPNFETDFCPLFCGGKPQLSAEGLKTAYEVFTEGKGKENLQGLLWKRMVRNERTRLRNHYEPHERICLPEEQYQGNYSDVLRNTALQCERLREAGYPEGALRWSLALPWILSFSTDRTSAKKKGRDSYFELLKSQKNCAEELFVYDKDGRVKEELLYKLPQQNLAMHQICEKNVQNRKAAQLLWMPPSVPLYKAGDNSIFTEYSDYSKLLVFAEFRYLQRGGARLLSDYCRLLCKVDGDTDLDEIILEIKSDNKQEWEKDEYCLTAVDRRRQTLDDLLKEVKISGCEKNGDTEKWKLYLVASPAMCAKRLLGKDYQARMTEAFNSYFNSPGVKEALWSWLKDNGYADRIEEGILRYCAEGNLYTVLEEWLFCMKDKDPEKQMAYIETVLYREHSKVGVRTHKLTVETPYEDGFVAPCGFAEQLTGDIGDIGSGQKEESKACVDSFNSPFYPMIMFAGRGAQEGIDMHNYCLRIMHLTLPKGAVSYEQRNGRIDRYRSLLVRRRAAECTDGIPVEECSGLIARSFAYLIECKQEDDANKDDVLYPNWSICNVNSRWRFEELMPAWDFTEESCFISTMDSMLESYRKSMGVHDKLNSIDLSTLYEK